MNHTRRILLTFLCLLALLLAIPVALTWREARQKRLNRELIIAVWRNNTPAVRQLLDQGADPNLLFMPGETLSAFSLGLGSRTVPGPVDLATDPRSWWQHFIDRLHTQPIHHSALMETIEYPSNPYAFVDNADMVQALVEAGANVNFRAENGRTPLLEAAYLGEWNTLQVLLRHHANVNAADENGQTALMLAAQYSNVKIVEMLLNRGANINARDENGDTVLLLALVPYSSASIQPVRETVACLLRHGASVEVKDKDGDTVVDRATWFGDKQLIQMLKQAGAK